MAEGKSKSERLDLRGTRFQKENIAKHISRNRHWANSRGNSDGSIRSASRYFRPAPLACHDHCSSKRRLRPSGGSLATAPHPVVDVCGYTLRGESSSLALLEAAFPRSASGATMAATAMGGCRGGAEVLCRGLQEDGARHLRAARRDSPAAAGGPSRPSPAQAGQTPKVRTRRP